MAFKKQIKAEVERAVEDVLKTKSFKKWLRSEARKQIMYDLRENLAEFLPHEWLDRMARKAIQKIIPDLG